MIFTAIDAPTLERGRGCCKVRRVLLFVILGFFLPGLAFTAEPTPDQILWKAALKGEGNVDAVKTALSRGADANVRKGGWSILMRVSRKGNSEIAQLLVAHGADPNAKGFNGETALTIAAEHGHVEIMKLLLSSGADKNAETNHGDTALHYAAEYGHRDIVRFLLDAGIDLNKKDQDGETPLTIAKRRNHAEIVQLLKSAGAGQ